MRQFGSIYREIRRGSDNKICPREAAELATQLLSLYLSDQYVDENEWGNEQDVEPNFIAVDDMLLKNPGLLMRHERAVLSDVYEDDIYQPTMRTSSAFYEWAIV